MRESMGEQLFRWKESTRDKTADKRSAKKKRRQDDFSEAELRELMGTGKQRLHRGKGGAFKR